VLVEGGRPIGYGYGALIRADPTGAPAMATNFEDFCLWVYVTVDELWEPIAAGPVRQTRMVYAGLLLVLSMAVRNPFANCAASLVAKKCR